MNHLKTEKQTPLLDTCMSIHLSLNVFPFLVCNILQATTARLVRTSVTPTPVPLGSIAPLGVSNRLSAHQGNTKTSRGSHPVKLAHQVCFSTHIHIVTCSGQML